MAQCSVWALVSRGKIKNYQQMEIWKIINRGTILIDTKKTGSRYYQVTQIETIECPIL